MNLSKHGESRLVYSSETGRVDEPKRQSKKGEENRPQTINDGIVRVRRETKGRGGGCVIVIAGLPQNSNLKEIAASIKKKCGCGGSVKNGCIEIQGDKREEIKTELEKLGFKVKLAGG